MFRLDRKTAIITGAGSGIGKVMALLFARQGATVFILDIDATGTQERDSLDILVDNAGIAHVGNAEDTEESDFDRLMQVNAKQRLQARTNVKT